MNNPQLTSTCEVKINNPRQRLPLDVPSIRILLYADDPNGIRTGNDTSDLNTMIDHLRARDPAFGHFEVTWMSRNCPGSDNRLTPQRLQLFDEIWFFGIHQLNNEPDAPQSELDQQELLALTDWMKIDDTQGFTGGGVLMTGDHNDIRPDGGTAGQNPSCPDTSTEALLGLGRALGRCVPRAGLLRKWEGFPTNNPPENRFNTQTPSQGLGTLGGQLQTDASPMLLVLSRFDATGNPTSTDGDPHPLFKSLQGRVIQAFPDHIHEGAVVIPDTFDESIWPKGQVIWPKPQVVARGLDYHNGALGNVLAAYDGDAAAVGRVVADSTWHHYINENLENFPPGAPVNSNADQIGQFYANLALWLVPFEKRAQMALFMFAWLASRLSVREESRAAANEGNEPSLEQVAAVGRAAYLELSRVASPCEVHELLTALLPPEYRVHFPTIYLPETGVSLSLFPSKEITLGFIIDSYQRAIIKLPDINPEERRSRVVASIWDGFRLAFKSHVNILTHFAEEARKAHDLSFD